MQFLSNYAAMQVKDGLTRTMGIGEVTLLGTRDYGVRVWLDPEKLAARNLTARDIVDAIRARNIQISAKKIGAPPVPKGQPFEFKLDSIGLINDLSDATKIVVKSRDGVLVPLKDLARIEWEAGPADSFVSVNGKPGVVLGVYPTSGSNANALSQTIAKKIAELQSRAPAGLNVEVAFDFTMNLESPRNPVAAEYLLLDLQLPVGASMERVRGALAGSEKLLRGLTGVQDVLAMTDNPFDILRHHQACLLVRLAPDNKRKIRREEIIATIRSQVAKMPDAVVQLRDLSRSDSSPGFGYPIRLAVIDREDHGAAALNQAVAMFAERLEKSKKLTDVSVNRACMPHPSLELHIDQARATAAGVAMQDIIDTLQIHAGSLQVNDFNRFGRTWQVNIQASGKFLDDAESLKQLKVHDSKGRTVPLGALATLRTVSGQAVVMRLNRYRMIDITANPAAGVSAKEARNLCETEFEQMRKEARTPGGVRLSWLD